MGFIEFIPHDTKINFVGTSKYFIAASTILVIASLALIIYRWHNHTINWGIDFDGGLELRVEFIDSAKDADIGQVREALADGTVITYNAQEVDPKNPSQSVEKTVEFQLQGVTVNHFVMEGHETVYSIKTKGEASFKSSDESLNYLASGLREYLEKSFGTGKVLIVSTDMVGPRVGATLRKQGVWAIFYALLGIMVYVGLRFNFRYSPGGIVAIFHDVIITLGILVLFNREINLIIVAALLTLAGFSINDTIVIFDRIREDRERKLRNVPLGKAVNIAINETLSRTVLTALTVFFVVASLLLLGGAILFDFALCMTIGVVIGAYSTVFIAAPLYVGLENWYALARKARGALR